MPHYNVLVADPIAEKGIEELQMDPSITVDINLGENNKGLKESELIALAPGYDAMVVRSGVKITGAVIEASAGRLKAIGRAGVGVDNIDIPAATKHGAVVMNTPGGNTISTAEHAFTLMMSLARHIPQAHQYVNEGRFKEGRKACQGVELYNKTLASLGMGRIGSEFARRAIAFGMRVVAYDPYLSESKAKLLRVELCDDIDSAVSQADFITLHMPKTKETTHMIDRARIAKMKKGVRIINCARGGLIDETALLEGLESGQVGGAALDVFEVEPPPETFGLLNRPDVVLTPHLGASTEEAQENVGIEIAVAIRDMLLTGSVANAVNMPNIDSQTMARIGGHLRLAEVLGRIASQLAPRQPDVFRIEYTGHVASLDTTLITRASLKGYLDVVSGPGSANYLNAPSLAEGRGMRVTETRPAGPAEFTDLIEVVVGSGKESVSVAGTFFGSQPRIVKLRGRYVEAAPEGCLLLLENEDAPGMVGAVGVMLGEHRINIASMSLSRNNAGGRALSVLNLDSTPDDALLAKLEEIDGITEAKALSL